MRRLNVLVLALIIFVQAPIQAAPQQPANSSSAEARIIVSPSDDVEIETVRGEATPEEINKIIDAVPPSEDLMVSTDSPLVAVDLANKVTEEERASAGLGKKLATGLRRLIPLGPLKRFGRHLVKSARSDRIGFVLVTINTGYDSYTWMHATQYSPEVRALQAIYSIVMTLAFSIDKDSWAHVANHLHHKILRIFDFAKARRTIRRKFWRILCLYSANFAMGLVSNSARFGIFAIDKINQPHFVRNSLISLGVLSAAYTVSSTPWTEFARRVKINRHPFAKVVVRRMAEIRSLTMGHVAPSSKLLQANIYGYTPWVAMGISGVIGIVNMMNTRPFANWVESSPRMRWFRVSVTTLTQASQKSFDWLKDRAKTCQQYLAGRRNSDL